MSISPQGALEGMLGFRHGAFWSFGEGEEVKERKNLVVQALRSRVSRRSWELGCRAARVLPVVLGSLAVLMGRFFLGLAMSSSI